MDEDSTSWVDVGKIIRVIPEGDKHEKAIELMKTATENCYGCKIHPKIWNKIKMRFDKQRQMRRSKTSSESQLY
ncbi:hypothetical protein B4U80_05420 [Leptotrombidium deliense]|uniref:Uncharacterized protein n=1 Tax=Leptotrombidium deliense TaxID=299467 RepID=A0A443S9I2_9ACAR|nr:hypothetical protein B4U80_05420 [Leptotrombidium deliense]